MKIKASVLLNVLLVVALLSLVLFTANTAETASGSSYDPWIDLNDDGKIDYEDLLQLAAVYGTSGTPINKTELLLDLLARVEALEAKFPITTGNIADYAVTNKKLAPNAVQLWSTQRTSKYGGLWPKDKWWGLESYVNINLLRKSDLMITFSTEAVDTLGAPFYIRACVGPYVARPSPKTLLAPLGFKEWSSYTYNFYLHDIPPGDYTVEIQWLSPYESIRYVWQRSLTVIALPA